MIRILIILTILISSSLDAFSTHQRAGQITYRHVSGNTYKFEIVTYTKSSALADRPYLRIKWGTEPADITFEETDSIQRTLLIENIGNDIQENHYVVDHTYDGPGTYVITVMDPNRTSGVNNMIASVTEAICFSSLLKISNTFAPNNSVVFGSPHIQVACANEAWIYDPLASDSDGDDLLFGIVPSKGVQCTSIDSWELPTVWTATNLDTFEINPQTGVITWNTPLVEGQYNFGVQVQEFRDGVLVGIVEREIQVIINCTITIGINEIENNNFFIFPNPATDLISWTTDKPISSVEVYSSTGALVLKESLNGKNQINITNFATGIYTIRATNSLGEVFIKQVSVTGK